MVSSGDLGVGGVDRFSGVDRDPDLGGSARCLLRQQPQAQGEGAEEVSAIVVRRRRGRHAKAVRHPVRLVSWVLADHDDRVVSVVQNVIYGVALFVLFVLVGVQR